MRHILLASILAAALAACDENRLGPDQTPADTTTAAPVGFFTTLSAGQHHACGLTPQGAAYCWGWAAGALGTGEARREEARRPVRVATASVFDTLSGGSNATCGLSSGVVLCWGGNEFGQIG